MTRPDRRVASFAHLGKALAADDTIGPVQDADEANAQEPTTPCDMCEGSGTFGGDECPGCDGEGELTATQKADKAKRFADDLDGAVARAGRKAPAAKGVLAGMAKAIKVAEGRAAAPAPRKPKAGTQAAAIVAAYDRAERKPVRGGR